jgi:hypothetical protein
MVEEKKNETNVKTDEDRMLLEIKLVYPMFDWFTSLDLLFPILDGEKNRLPAVISKNQVQDKQFYFVVYEYNNLSGLKVFQLEDKKVLNSVDFKNYPDMHTLFKYFVLLSVNYFNSQGINVTSSYSDMPVDAFLSKSDNILN